MMRTHRLAIVTLAASLSGVAAALPLDMARAASTPVDQAAPASAPADAGPGLAPQPARRPASRAQIRQQKLDDLFARLAVSTDASETSGLMLAIDRLQLESDSSTAELLMARAVGALETHRFEASLALLDKMVVLQPQWAEAWNKRATVRHLMGDDDGAMADIAHVLKLEPRHLGALSGLGLILESRGFRDDALRVYRRALEVAPQLKSLRDAVARLTVVVDGQRL
jgi:tetratricopeptide (TPR) repeat protein